MSPMPIGGSEKSRARAQAQRARILEAARECFSESGFHGASMARIGERAGMSAGLIYRYFASKAEIIRAIAEGQREVRMRTMAEVGSRLELLERVLDKLSEWRRAGLAPGAFDPALFLEVTAEAGRDPAIAALVGAQEEQACADMARIVEREALAAGVRLPPPALRRHALLLRCLVDGVILRCVRDPKLDFAQVRASLRSLVPPLEERPDQSGPV
ncbi:TetR/AcrR family transcriptional regulator [Arenimonas fontis]|uniref:Helix-turn-helix transcriptional regulator n=1 Tax=Arenimonas fontis TaxID=2608255 RepID=A0A5B2Z8V0_9GAMM|nr:TetR/AcrR family transcriptional regulator [Arenimonas fontis]KAA2284315.1 helix-turn-helix transcriptional regulator [Arenimonas fontis]